MKRSALIFLAAAFVFGLSWQPAYAVKPFFDEFKAKYVKPDGNETEKALAEKVDKVKCNVCHEGKQKKMRNAYGNALDELLDRKTDLKNKEKIQEALETVAGLHSDPEDEKSPTFGELIEKGNLPGGDEEIGGEAPAAAEASPAASADDKPDDEEGFEALFDGTDIEKFMIVNKQGPGYVIEDGILVCPPDGGGNLYTNKEYSDFVLRFEVRMEPGGNNGVGIRAPLEGDAAYKGMEIQILDDYADQYATLQPYQYHGSVYGVFPAKRGALKKAGEWNTEEILCEGRHVKVTLNDEVIVDADLDDVTDEEVLKVHPGLARESGHIGFLGHGTRVEFRNVRVKDLSEK